MNRSKTLFAMTVITIILAVALGRNAFSATCYVTNSSASAAQGTLLHALSRQFGTSWNECSEIKFAISGTILLPSQIHINKGVVLDGENKVTLKPTANFTYDVSDGCFVRLVNVRSGVTSETTYGDGNSIIKNIVLDASNITARVVCAYSDGNDITSATIQNGKNYGVMVNKGIGNLITATNIIANPAKGIYLANNGNNMLPAPANPVIIFDTIDAKQYILLARVTPATNTVDVFDSTGQTVQQGIYKQSLGLSSGLTTTSGGNKYFAIDAILPGQATTSVTTTARDNEYNTSEFSGKAVAFQYDLAKCTIDQTLLNRYIANPAANPCITPIQCIYTTCSDVANKPECVNEFSQCCAKNPKDPACPITPCTDKDKDGVCDKDDNCANAYNKAQINVDKDYAGDICDPYLPPCVEYFNIFQDDKSTVDEKDEAVAIFNICCNTEEHYNEQVCKNYRCLFAFILGLVFGDKDYDGKLDASDNCPNIPNGPCKGDTNQTDTDKDGIGDACDNCPFVFNADQKDTNKNGAGDACETKNWENEDFDNDGVLNGVDNCIATPNPAQEDMDGDGIGNACDIDIDGDEIDNFSDNCPNVVNTDQKDMDGDGVGNVCDPINGAIMNDDFDGDGVPNNQDNCIFVKNPNQADSDRNGVGDACQTALDEAAGDIDGDGILNNLDNCPVTYNPNQADSDNDKIGDACEGLVYTGDLDGDLVPDWIDNCITVRNPDQHDSDRDGIGDACEMDMTINFEQLKDIDGDGILNFGTNTFDNCPVTWNPSQKDSDKDGIGDVCDLDFMLLQPDEDLDGDGIKNKNDNCPAVPNPKQEDLDRNGIGDVCDLGAIPNLGIGGGGGDGFEITGGRRANGEACSLVRTATQSAPWFYMPLAGLPVIGLMIRRKLLK